MHIWIYIYLAVYKDIIVSHMGIVPSLEEYTPNRSTCLTTNSWQLQFVPSYVFMLF